jgi:hypothetical protein
MVAWVSSRSRTVRASLTTLTDRIDPRKVAARRLFAHDRHARRRRIVGGREAAAPQQAQTQHIKVLGRDQISSSG